MFYLIINNAKSQAISAFDSQLELPPRKIKKYSNRPPRNLAAEPRVGHLPSVRVQVAPVPLRPRAGAVLHAEGPRDVPRYQGQGVRPALQEERHQEVGQDAGLRGAQERKRGQFSVRV